jgi:hypothetical protein
MGNRLLVPRGGLAALHALAEADEAAAVGQVRGGAIEAPYAAVPRASVGARFAERRAGWDAEGFAGKDGARRRRTACCRQENEAPPEDRSKRMHAGVVSIRRTNARFHEESASPCAGADFPVRREGEQRGSLGALRLARAQGAVSGVRNQPGVFTAPSSSLIRSISFRCRSASSSDEARHRSEIAAPRRSASSRRCPPPGVVHRLRAAWMSRSTSRCRWSPRLRPTAPHAIFLSPYRAPSSLISPAPSRRRA